MSLSSVIGALRVNLALDSAEFSSGVKKAEASSKSLQKVMTVAASSTVAVGGALVAFGAKAISAATELKNFAAVANAGFEEFQGWEAGAKTVGIQSEKLADILKDVNDKVGDYFQTGGGAMKDFFENIAPKVGITADAFRNLSGPQALQLYVSSLEKAGVSQADMTFYMEAIASDATALVPLLRNGGAAMNGFAQAAKDSGAIMSQSTADSLLRAKASIAEMKTAVLGLGTGMVSQVAPALEKGAAALASFVKNSSGLRAVADLVGGTLSVAAGALTVVINNLGTAIIAVSALAAGRLVSAMVAAAGSITVANLASLRFIAGMTAGAVAMRAQAAAAGLLRAAYAAVGGPVGLVVAGLGLMAAGFMRARQRAEESRQTINSLKDAYVAYENARKAADEAPSVETLEAKKVAAQEKLNLLLEREKQIKQEMSGAGLRAQMGDGGAADRVGVLRQEMMTVRDDIIATNYQVALLGQTLSGPAADGARVLTKETIDTVAKLQEATAQKVEQNRLDAIGLQYGQDSLVYKEAVAASTRDQELATLNALAAQVDGNAEAEAAVQHAIDVANATYDAEVAGYAFANAMASVNAQIQNIARSLAAISGFQIQAAAAKVETTALQQGKSMAEAAKLGMQAQRNAEYGEQRKAIIAQYAGQYDTPAYQTAIRMLNEEESAANKAAAAQDALGEAREVAMKKERDAEKGGGGGGRSRAGGGGGRSGGAPKKSDEEREAERTADRQSDAMRKLVEEHQLYQQTLGMSEQAERIFRASQETGALGDEAKVAKVRQLIVETDALKRAKEGLRNVVDTLDKGFGDMFTGFITGANSAKDAAKNLLAQLGQMLANSAWRTLWDGTSSGFGGIGSVVSGWLGGIGQNANGTNNWSGGLTWVGERGPELLNLSRGSQIISNPASRRLVEGSGGGRSAVEISLGEGLEARILSQANDNAIRITRGGLASYDAKQSGNTWNRVRKDPRVKG